MRGFAETREGHPAGEGPGAAREVAPADIPDLCADGHGGPGRNSRLDNRHLANRPFVSASPPHFPHSQRNVSEPAPSFKRIGEIARGLGAEPGRVGVPQFIGELRVLFETRLREMRPDMAKDLLREVFGEERAAAIAAAIVPEAPAAPAETPGTPEEGGAGGEPRPEPDPGTGAEPQGRLL